MQQNRKEVRKKVNVMSTRGLILGNLIRAIVIEDCFGVLSFKGERKTRHQGYCNRQMKKINFNSSHVDSFGSSGSQFTFKTKGTKSPLHNYLPLCFIVFKSRFLTKLKNKPPKIGSQIGRKAELHRRSMENDEQYSSVCHKWSC